MKGEKKNNLLILLFQEGVIQQEGNVFIAERAFLANGFIKWIRREIKKSNLKPEDVEKKMHILRLFLKGDVELKWSGDKIIVIKKSVPHQKALDEYRRANNLE